MDPRLRRAFTPGLPLHPGQDMCGLKGIGTRKDTVIAGTKVIGPYRLTRALGGSAHAMKAAATSRVIGKAIEAGSTTTIIGTATATGIQTVVMTTIMTGINKNSRPGCSKPAFSLH